MTSVTFDCGAVYNWGAMLDSLYNIAKSGSSNLETVVASKKTSVETAIQTLLDNIGE